MHQSLKPPIMKAFFRFAFGIFFTVVIFSSCGKKNETGSRVPNDAVFVVYVNTNSMSSKLSWNDIKQTDWFKNTYADPKTADWRKKILDNPASSGIDFDKGLIFFSKKSSGDDYFFVAEGTIKNVKDFEQFNKNFDPQQVVKKQGDVNLLTLKDKNVVGWKGNHFAYVMNAKTTHSEMYSFKDSGNAVTISPAGNNEELAAFCTQLFNLKSDSSLGKDEIFGSLLNEKSDIQVWQNTEQIVKNLPSGASLGMLKLDAFLKDNFTTYSINFENGKIETVIKNHFSKELTGIFKKYLGGKINTDLIKKIPSQNIAAIFSANFKPEGIVELIKLTGADGIINSYIQQMGFTLDDFSKATNGDVLLAITDLTFKKDTSDGTADTAYKQNLQKKLSPQFNYVFSTGVSDKASLQKLMDAVIKMQGFLGNDISFSHAMDDKNLVISNTANYGQQFLSSSGNKFSFIEKLQGHPAGAFVDFQKIFAAIPNAFSKQADSALILQNKKMWKDFYLTGGEYQNDAFTSNAQVNLMDGNTNSLKQLNAFLNGIYTIHEKEKSANVHLKNLDSLLTPPAIDTVNSK